MRTSQMLRHNRGAYAITPGEYHHRMARVRAYQRALAMADWTLFAPLDYRRWAGGTMAHRDAERSEAVTGDGDPLGLVDPLVGAPLVQEVSADRPVWTEGGVEFNGNESLLMGQQSIPQISSGFTPDNSDNGGSLGFLYNLGGSTEDGRIFGFVNDGTNTFIDIRLNDSVGGRLRIRTRLDGGIITDDSFSGLPVADDTLLFLVKDPSAETMTVYSDGAEVGVLSNYRNDTSSSPPEYNPAVGAWNVRGSVSDGMIGALAASFFSDEVLPASTIAQISDLLL